MVYGDLDFGPLWAVIGAAEMLTDRRAERLLFGKRSGRPNTDRLSLAVRFLLLGGSRLLFGRCNVDAIVPRGAIAAESISDGSCRIMTRISGLRWQKLAARAADTGVLRSQ